jgi:SAM-dependent methyltransferase
MPGHHGGVDESPRAVFDGAYYRRFYRDRPVHGRRQIAKLAEGVTGLCGWWYIPIRTVLDIGAGPGYWRDWFAERKPSVRYTSTDVSEYACRRYGHQQRDITRWRPARPFDLVVCQGVLHYLDDRAAERAIDNIAAATRSVVYFEIPTRQDRDDVIDPERTDLAVHWRTGAWYRKRLDRHFAELGGGLWYARTGPLDFYELERGRGVPSLASLR